MQGRQSNAPTVASNNEALVDPNSQLMKTDLVYPKDYLVVSRRVWVAFSGWYPNLKVLARKVIQYSKGLNTNKNL